MAETSEGWDGTVNEAAIARILAAAAGPRIEDGFLLEVVAGQRRVILSAGESHHGFIRYVNDAPRIIDLPAPAAGGQWHLIVQRRDWATNTVTTLALLSEATPVGSSGVPPLDYPDGYADTPGVAADFPLYWVWVRATDNEVRYRRAVLHERSYGRSVLAEWATKSGPNLHVAPYTNRWTKGLDSGGTVNATSDADAIIIGEDGIYDVTALQRVNGSSPGSAYLNLAIDGNRSTLENRANGAWFHDHGSGNYTSSQSRYLGPLARGERITAGPPSGAGGGLYYGAQGLYGGIWLRRIS